MTGDAGKKGISIKGEDGKTQVAGLNGKDGVGHLELAGKDGTPSIDMTAITGDTDVDGDPNDETAKITRLNYKDKAGKDHQVATLDDGMKYAGDNADTKILAKKLNSRVDIIGNIGTGKTETDFTEGNIGVFANADGKLHVKLAKAITANTLTLEDSDNPQAPAAKKPITLTNKKGGLYIGDPLTDDGNKVVTRSELTTSSEAGQNALQTIQVKAGETVVKTLKKPTEANGTANVLEFEAGENVQITSDEGKVKISSKRDQSADTITVGVKGKDGKDGKDGKIGVDGKDGKSGVGIDGKNGITITGHEDPVKPEPGKPGKDGRDGTIGINGLDGISMTGEAGKNGLSIKGKDGESIAGLNGKDGVGHLGLTGPKGDDGKAPSIDMTAIKGNAGVDGKDGITRLQYIDENKKPHQVATLDDGLKFIGNNLAVNEHRLNSTVKVVGQGLVSADDVTYDGKDTDTDKAKKAFLSDKKTQFEGTNDNIGVISNGGDTLTVSLSKNVKNLDSIGSKKVVIGDPDINGESKGHVTTLSTDDKGKLVLQKGTDKNALKEAILTATRENVDNGDGTKTPTDIIKLGEGPTKPNGKDGVNGTIGVNGKDGTSKVGIDGQNGVTVTGNNGKDGKNGTVGINGTNGITVTGHANGENGQNGKDGTIGINGTDGISMTGDAGKNGISIKGEDGKTQVAGLNGKDGVGHLELAGKNGTPSIDMTAITGNADVDGDPTKDTDKITRLNYIDPAQKDKEGHPINHQVATLTDGMKYAGDNADKNGTNVLKKKLNSRVDIVGDINGKEETAFTSGNIGVFANDDGKLHVKLAKALTGLNSVTAGTVKATTSIVVGDPDKGGKVATLTTSDDGKLMLQNAGVDTPREVLTVTETNNSTTIILGEKGEPGKTGKPGKNGYIGVNGKDGTAGVGIDGQNGITVTGDNGKDGKDGKNGTIGINGLDGISMTGEAGKNGISIKGKDGKTQVAGLNGKDGIGHLGLTGKAGKDGTPSIDMTAVEGKADVHDKKITRLNYKDQNDKDHQVATLDDGLKFAGNNKTVSKQTLNSTIRIVGKGLQAGDTDGEAKLSDGKTFVGTADNIGVIADDKGNLTVALHKDVKVDTVTAKKGITLGEGEGAVGLNGKDGKLVLEVKDKDGKTTETKEVLTTGSPNITVGSKAEKPHDGKPGTDGQDGTIGVNGKNGSAVVLNGKDGSIGLNGENGKDGISIRGKAGENIPGQDGINGKTGIDGTDVTRIVYTEKNPDGSDKKDTEGDPITHQVANLDDGMKYAGDNAKADGTNVLAKKLNNQVNIVGDIAKDKTENDFTKGNIGVFAENDGELHVKLAKTVDGLDKVSTKKVVIGDPDKNATTLSTDDTGRLVLQKGTKEDAPKETILTATQVTDPNGKVVGDELHLGIGKDGINGKITADGKDGKSKVGIDGTDGITITGHTDAKDGQPAKDGTIGINGTNGITMTSDAAKAGIKVGDGPVLNEDGLDMKDKGITGLGAISAKTINATGDDGKTPTVSMDGKNGTLSFAGTTGADGKAIPGVTLGTNNGRLVVLDDNNKPKDTVALVSDLQDVVNKADTAIMKIDRNVRNVGANAAAMAMLKPLQYDPLEPTQIMAAIGSYRGTQAAAIGLSHYTNESTMFNVGVSVGAGNNMMGVGVTRKFGSSADERAVPDRYKAGPISSVYVMQDEVTALKAENRQIKESYSKVLQDNEEMKAKLDALMKKLGL